MEHSHIKVGCFGHIIRCLTKNMIGTFMLLCLLYVYLYLMGTKPKFKEKKCPLLLGPSGIQPILKAKEIGFTTALYNVGFHRYVDCAAIFTGDEREIEYARSFRHCQPSIPTEQQYRENTKNCTHFKEYFGYNSFKISKEEQDFPLAFSILTFENFYQTERLLQAIYRPNNYYCIHVDTKSNEEFQKAFKSFVRCFENVFLATHQVNVKWSEFPVLEAEINCMLDLVRLKKWKYFINLTGREYPIRTNHEIVQILKSYGGANDIDGTLHRRPIIWTKYKWRNENWMTWSEKPPAPGDFNIAKGSTHIAASRAFVEYVTFNSTARALLNWMRDIRAPDEHYFPTLNHNPQKGVPGSYKGDPDIKRFLTRFKIWQSNEEYCDGVWFRFICNFGVGDLQRIAKAPELFANKFRLEFDPTAFACMEQWYINRTENTVNENGFDVDFYKSQMWVKHHV